MKLSRRLLGNTTAFALMAPLAHAQTDYPNKSIRFVVSYAAGGGTDGLVRIVAKSSPGNSLEMTSPDELRIHMQEKLKVSAEPIKSIDLKLD